MEALLGVPSAACARAAAVLADATAGATGAGDAALAALLERALAAWDDGGAQAAVAAGAPPRTDPRVPLHTVLGGGGGGVAALPSPSQVPARAAAAAAAAQAGWDVLHAGSWRDVPPSSRSLYAAAALLEVAADVAALAERTPQAPTGGAAPHLPRGGRATLRRCLRTLDVALMLGTPRDRPALFAAVAAVEAALAATASPPSPADGARSAAAAGASDPAPPPPPVPADAIEVPRLQLPSLAAFYGGYMCYRPASTSGSAAEAHARGGADDDDLRSVYEPGNVVATNTGGNGPPLGRPVVIAGALAGWPALRRWADPSYLASAAGDRTVPVEVGGHYMSDGWGQRLMSLRSFLRCYGGGVGAGGGRGRGDSSDDEGDEVAPSDAGADAAGDASAAASFGYLAQHPLFDQVPALRADIGPLPDYCSLTPPSPPAAAAAASSDDGGGGEPAAKRARVDDDSTSAAAEATHDADNADDDEGWGGVTVNAWLGPAGTVSCLHWDRPHNLLCQVVGAKRVLLVDPRHGARVYPHEGLMANTARVDPEAAAAAAQPLLPSEASVAAATTMTAAPTEAAAAAAFPRFAGTPVYVAALGPGDALYIPPRWWHHVRSLSRAFSVSLWWGGDGAP